MSTRKQHSPTAERKPIVFLGPSAPADQIRNILPEATILPPIARGQLYRAREQGESVFLIVDGVFGHELAVSPREVVDVLKDGALIYGSSSMGALRAAECWPAGMRGVGTITRLYKLGCLESDDEVAVATNPENGFSATSVALINIRYAVSKAVRTNLLSRSAAIHLVATAKNIFFPERTWPWILKQEGITDRQGRIASFCASKDLKKKDALRAAQVLKRAMLAQPQLSELHSPPDASTFLKTERYPGHDPFMGYDEETLNLQLAIWLIGSGRYQKYIWPLVLGEPEFRGVRAMKSPLGRAEALRERLAKVLSRFCADIALSVPRLTAELDFLEEREAEMMRWYAVTTVSENARSVGLSADKHLMARTREEVAIAHGLRDWQTLREDVSDGLLFGAIPLPWIEAACVSLALARTFKSSWAAQLENRSDVEV